MTDIKPDVKVTDLPDASPSDPLEALSWLGETVEEIADGLRARGIKGKVKIADSCPLANYLRVWWSDPSIYKEVSVADWNNNYYFHEQTPKPYVNFINRFDCFEYPDLIEP